MMSLFSSFDLHFYKLAISPSILMILFLIPKFHIFNLSNKIFEKLMNFMHYFFLSIKPKMFNKLFLNLLLSIMMMLFLLNFYSILPFNFSSTTQVSVIFFTSLTLWASIVIFSMYKNMNMFITHCIPEGTPMHLTWFLFLIEIISNSIRPITLTVRLTANILTGHLLMILLSKLVFFNFMATFFYTILNMVEIFVSFIQAYIFVTMVSLYYSEMH